jgi:dolichyl-phosphate-mannose-protein mannosyltransferase
MKTTRTAAALGLASFFFFLWNIGTPKDYSIDEFIFVPAANALLAHAPDPDPEGPPLGKLMIAAGIKALGNNPLGWRVGSAAFGSLTLVGVFFWMLLLVDSYPAALTASLLTLLNNFVYIFSRTALLDVFFVTFLVWGLMSFTAALKLHNASTTARRVWLLLSGIMFGFAGACKWNALDTWGIVIGVCIALCLSKRSTNSEIVELGRNLRETGIGWVAISLLAAPAVAYAVAFVPFLHPVSAHEWIARNHYIWSYHRAQIGNVFLCTPWYTWPLKIEPLRPFSYLVGNWYVMWAGLLALLICARRFGRSFAETLLVALYVGNLLQWPLTPQHCLFYYYYFACAMFVTVAIPIALRQFPERIWGVRLSVLSVLPALFVFAYCFPRMAHLNPPFDCALGCWP